MQQPVALNMLTNVRVLGGSPVVYGWSEILIRVLERTIPASSCGRV